MVEVVGDVTTFRQLQSQKGTFAGVSVGRWPGLLLTHLTSAPSFICLLLLHVQPGLFWGGVFLLGVYMCGGSSMNLVSAL